MAIRLRANPTITIAISVTYSMAATISIESVQVKTIISGTSRR